MDTIEVPVAEVQNALDAMAWTFNPYLDEPFRVHEYPYIVELILSSASVEVNVMSFNYF
jgi:hypothetical protein